MTAEPHPLAVLGAALLVSLAKGGIAGAVPMALATPLLAWVMPVGQAVAVALPILIVADVTALALYWREWDGGVIRRSLPAAVVGVAVGLPLLATMAPYDWVLKRVLGVLTLAALGSGRFVGRAVSRWTGPTAGVAAGVGSTLANAGAPPFGAYLLLCDLEPRALVATTTLFFAVVNALKLPGVVAAGLLDGRLAGATAWVLPLVPAGVWAGRWIVRRTRPGVFDEAVRVAVAVTGVVLLVG